MTDVRWMAVPLLLASLGAPVAIAEGPRCGTVRGQERELRLRHDLQARGRFGAAARHADADVGDVAVLFDQGDLVVRRNPFDLDGTSLRLSPDHAGGYTV